MRRSNSNNAGYKDMREAPFYLRADFFPVTEWQGALFFPTKDTEKQEGGSNNVFNNWENAWILVEGAKLNQNWRLNQNQVKCAAETKLLNPVGWSNALFAGSRNLSEEAIWNDKRPGGDIYIPSTTANDVNLGKCLHLFWSSVFLLFYQWRRNSCKWCEPWERFACTVIAQTALISTIYHKLL